MLSGKQGAFRDTVLMNAAAGLVVAEEAATMAEGIATAASAIDDGRATAVLEKLVQVSNG
jgi:anthranilate phosphoribosyltransferase